MQKAYRRRLSPILVCIVFYLLVYASFVVANFPFDTDVQRNDPATREKALRDFYKNAYAPVGPVDEAREARYIEVARKAAIGFDVLGTVRKFTESYGLHDKRVLDVGAGRGYLQDVVPDYTALDISPSVQRFFHKPFVLGSATAMPFRDNEFDAIWSIWVLEHVPNPEQALSEMRRVVKPGGVILLAPAWFCEPWAADGYEVRPYGDFGVYGKFVKATIPVRRLGAYSSVFPIRAVRNLSALSGSPTRFHYQRLTPNYDKYWVPDSDAVNRMDSNEAIRWFESRGDRCLSCPSSARSWIPLVIRITKAGILDQH
jgi:SAM-dependent methyltransferase